MSMPSRLYWFRKDTMLETKVAELELDVPDRKIWLTELSGEVAAPPMETYQRLSV
jgi:hypothetical protein